MEDSTKKLVDSLRICADWTEEVRAPGGTGCEGCKYFGAEENVCLSWLPEGGREKLLDEAADVIENLSQEASFYKALADCWQEFAQDAKRRFEELLRKMQRLEGEDER